MGPHAGKTEIEKGQYIAGVIDEEENEFWIRKAMRDGRCDQALKASPQPPEIAKLISELVFADQRDNQRRRRPVAEIERQGDVEREPAARREDRVPEKPATRHDRGKDDLEGMVRRRGFFPRCQRQKHRRKSAEANATMARWAGPKSTKGGRITVL